MILMRYRFYRGFTMHGVTYALLHRDKNAHYSTNYSTILTFGALISLHPYPFLHLSQSGLILFLLGTSRMQPREQNKQS